MKKNVFARLLALGVAVAAPAVSFAVAPTDAASLGASVVMTDALAGILAVAGVLTLFYVSVKGVDLVIRKIKGA